MTETHAGAMRAGQDYKIQASGGEWDRHYIGDIRVQRVERLSDERVNVHGLIRWDDQPENFRPTKAIFRTYERVIWLGPTNQGAQA